jgi:hypothetical protein
VPPYFSLRALSLQGYRGPCYDLKNYVRLAKIGFFAQSATFHIKNRSWNWFSRKRQVFSPKIGENRRKLVKIAENW